MTTDGTTPDRTPPSRLAHLLPDAGPVDPSLSGRLPDLSLPLTKDRTETADLAARVGAEGHRFLSPETCGFALVELDRLFRQDAERAAGEAP